MSLQEVKKRITELERQLESIKTEMGRSPLRIEPAITVQNYSLVRRAKIQTGGVGPVGHLKELYVKLLDKDGNETGSAFYALPVEHLGSNDFSGNVWPKYSDGKNIAIFKDLNGTWYIIPPFDDQKVCGA